MGEYWREEIETKLGLDVMIGFEEEGLERVFDVSQYSNLKQMWHIIKTKTADNYATLDLRSLWNNRAKFKQIWTDTGNGVGKAAWGNIKEQFVNPENNVKGFVENLNEPMMRMGEHPSGACHASARGLAKLAAYMANRGQF